MQLATACNAAIESNTACRFVLVPRRISSENAWTNDRAAAAAVASPRKSACLFQSFGLNRCLGAESPEMDSHPSATQSRTGSRLRPASTRAVYHKPSSWHMIPQDQYWCIVSKVTSSSPSHADSVALSRGPHSKASLFHPLRVSISAKSFLVGCARNMFNVCLKPSWVWKVQPLKDPWDTLTCPAADLQPLSTFVHFGHGFRPADPFAPLKALRPSWSARRTTWSI